MIPAMPESPGPQRALVGCLLGTAVGDALGLPMEGLSKSRQAKMFPDLDRYHFLPGKGMVSDDTQHQCIVAQALIKSNGIPEAFAKDIAWRLRFWLLRIPAGVGRATLRAVIKLWLGWAPHKSGVFSAGKEGIPEQWLDSICEWPQTVGGMERLGAQLAESLTHGKPLKPLSVPFAFSFLRNLFFTAVVLLHGFRRMLPPY